MKRLKRPTLAENKRIEQAIAGDPDTFEASEEQMMAARRGRPHLPAEQRKQRITIMLDRDLVERLRASGKGWQTRINDALRKVVG